jgi:hypothetical protein
LRKKLDEPWKRSGRFAEEKNPYHFQEWNPGYPEKKLQLTLLSLTCFTKKIPLISGVYKGVILSKCSSKFLTPSHFLPHIRPIYKQASNIWIEERRHATRKGLLTHIS